MPGLPGFPGPRGLKGISGKGKLLPLTIELRIWEKNSLGRNCIISAEGLPGYAGNPGRGGRPGLAGFSGEKGKNKSS